MPKLVYIVFLSLAWHNTCKAQSGRDTDWTIDSLKEELKKVNIQLKSSRATAYRLECLLTAKEMALRSVDIRDTVLQSLVALQAFKFNKDYNGDPNDIDIYRALLKAMARFRDGIDKNVPTDATSGKMDYALVSTAIADKLCSKMKRNLRIEEWSRFCPHLAYESTCKIQAGNK